VNIPPHFERVAALPC